MQKAFLKILSEHPAIWSFKNKKSSLKKFIILYKLQVKQNLISLGLGEKSLCLYLLII